MMTVVLSHKVWERFVTQKEITNDMHDHLGSILAKNLNLNLHMPIYLTTDLEEIEGQRNVLNKYAMGCN